MRLIENEQLDFDDVLIMPRRSSLNSRSEVDIYREFKWCGKSGVIHTMNVIPVMGSNMYPIAVPKVAKIFAENDFCSILEKHIPENDLLTLFDTVNDNGSVDNLFPSTGLNDSLTGLITLRDNALLTGIVIDVPNGYCPALLERVKLIRDTFPEAFIIAGNVVTADMCQDLINAGANAVKVGIGNGQQCITRLKTGVGRPQFSTIVECADACHQMGAYCISDGGCSTVGDICKALGAGADMVICGSMFGGCDEADAEAQVFDGKLYKQFYGMSSKLAQEKLFGGMKSYRTSEGREKWIPVTGPLKNTLDDITGGLRSCCTYVGAKKIKHMSRQTTFYKVRRQVNANFANCKDIEVESV